MMILKIPGRDPDLRAKVTIPTVLNKQIAVIFREAVSPLGVNVSS